MKKLLFQKNRFMILLVIAMFLLTVYQASAANFTDGWTSDSIGLVNTRAMVLSDDGEDLYAGNLGYNLAKITTSNGSTEWLKDLGNYRAQYHSLDYYNSKIYLGTIQYTTTSLIYEILANGTTVYTNDFGSASFQAVDNGLNYYAVHDNKLYRLNSTGDVVYTNSDYTSVIDLIQDDTTGDVYVLADGLLIKLDSGLFSEEWNISLSGSRNLEIDDYGNVYTITNSNYLKKINPNGVEQFSTYIGPGGYEVSVSPNGENIYYTYLPGTGYIGKLDGQGNFQYNKSLGTNFTSTLTLVSYEDSVYVADDNARVHQYLDQNYNSTPVTSYPYIESYTLSDDTPQIDQELIVSIIADSNNDSSIITYGIKCQDAANYSESLYSELFCVYSVAGDYNITIAVTDQFNNGSWFDETVIPITVSSQTFTGGLISIEVQDDTDSSYVEGALITLNDKNTTTDSLGRGTITTDEETDYVAVITKTGYYDKYQTITADGRVEVIRIEPLLLSGTTNIIVNVDDEENGLPIEDVFVSITNNLNYNYDYRYTDANGQIIFNNVASGTYTLTASFDDYDDLTLSFNVPQGGTTTKDLSLEKISFDFVGSSTDRNCVDDGLWLCGSDSIVETKCVIDNDCSLTNFCTPGVNTCSRFNYSKCDDIGMPRTQKCVVKLSSEQTMNNVTNWMLTNLLWVIIMLILLVSAGLLFIAWKK